MNEIIKQYQKIEQEEKSQMNSNTQYCQYLYVQYYGQLLEQLSQVPFLEDISWQADMAVNQTLLGTSYPLYFFHHMMHVNDYQQDAKRLLQQAGIKELHAESSGIYFQYQNQNYHITNLFSTFLSEPLKEKLYADIHMKPRNCHQLAVDIAREIKGEVYTGYLQFPTMKMFHSWCVKDGLVYDTMYDFALTEELYETIFEPVDVIAISYDQILNDEIEVEDITIPYPVYLYCDYKNTIGQK